MIKDSKHTIETINKIKLAKRGQNLGHPYWGPKDMFAHIKKISQISGEKRRKIYPPKICPICSTTYFVKSKDTTVKTCSHKCAGKLSAQTSGIANLTRGKNPPIGSGRCKWYRYFSPICGDIKVQGTWELRYVYCLDKMNILWRPNHNKDRFEYLNLKNKVATYNPDFWVNGKYVDVKGYIDKSTKHKLEAIKSMGIPLEIITWEKLKELEVRLLGKSIGGPDTPKSFLNNYQVISL